MFYIRLFQKEGSTKKKKKKSDKSDPNRPKRPMTSYMMWFSSNRNEIKEKNPEASLTELSKIAGEMWREMDAEKKSVSFTGL